MCCPHSGAVGVLRRVERTQDRRGTRASHERDSIDTEYRVPTLRSLVPGDFFENPILTAHPARRRSHRAPTTTQNAYCTHAAHALRTHAYATHTHFLFFSRHLHRLTRGRTITLLLHILLRLTHLLRTALLLRIRPVLGAYCKRVSIALCFTVSSDILSSRGARSLYTHLCPTRL